MQTLRNKDLPDAALFLERCRGNEPAHCQAACPLHIDNRRMAGLIAAIQAPATTNDERSQFRPAADGSIASTENRCGPTAWHAAPVRHGSYALHYSWQIN